MSDARISGLVGGDESGVSGFYFGAKCSVGDRRAGGGMVLSDFGVAGGDNVPGVETVENRHVLGIVGFGTIRDFGNLHGPVGGGGVVGVDGGINGVSRITAD